MPQVLHHLLCAQLHAEEPAVYSVLLDRRRAAAADVKVLFAAARHGALQGLLHIYETLDEDALQFVAEALPIVSEAMEDTDSRVRQVRTCTLVRKLFAFTRIYHFACEAKSTAWHWLHRLRCERCVYLTP